MTLYTCIINIIITINIISVFTIFIIHVHGICPLTSPDATRFNLMELLRGAASRRELRSRLTSRERAGFDVYGLRFI